MFTGPRGRGGPLGKVRLVEQLGKTDKSSILEGHPGPKRGRWERLKDI